MALPMHKNKPKPTPPANPLANWNIRSTIDRDMHVEGVVTTANSVMCRGSVKGSVILLEPSCLFLLTDTGRLEGDIIAENVIVMGEVSGRIKCRDVFFTPGSRFAGEVYYETIRMDAGSEINAKFMDRVEFDYKGLME